MHLEARLEVTPWFDVDTATRIEVIDRVFIPVVEFGFRWITGTKTDIGARRTWFTSAVSVFGSNPKPVSGSGLQIFEGAGK